MVLKSAYQGDLDTCFLAVQLKESYIFAKKSILATNDQTYKVLKQLALNISSVFVYGA